MANDMSPQRRVLVLATVLLALMVAVVGLGAVRMSGAVEEFEQLTSREYAALDYVLHIDRDLFRAQRQIELAAVADSRERVQDNIDEYENQVVRVGDRWKKYLSVAATTRSDIEANEDYETAWTVWITSNELLRRDAVAGNQVEQARLEQSQEAFEDVRGAIHNIEENLVDLALRPG